MFGSVPYTSWLTKEKNCCRSNISIAHFSQRVSTCIPCWVKCNCCLIAHGNTIQQLKTGCKTGNIVCSWKDKGSQCQQMQLPDVNFGQEGQGEHFFKKCHRIFNTQKSLQSWHHILFKIKSPGTLTLCCFIDLVLWWGRVTYMASLADLSSRFRR